ncbi:MAG: hypothetical protein M3358_04265 [Actinomycetota bacterium]|jgi:hypothetical protein|nr:hypothetical protein [Actinomycetota bacterium]
MKAEHPEAEAATALLRRFEPVIRSTKGDKFYPMDVEPYVRACSLWVQRPGEEAICAVPSGKLSLDRISQQPLDESGAVHFLRFTDPQDAKPSSRRARLKLFRRRAARGLRESREAFRAGRGRLARVGYMSRFVDAFYSITLLARGRVPGESAAAASVAYERIMAEHEHYRYHGRVVRQDGWVILEYWMFYPFNDWRSGFFGANDHEADWEKIYVYLSESETTGEVRPEWVAYAAHNYTGDNLRRRWDDPEVEKVGEHPVIYVGAGSHASYYAPGEYLTELDLPLPRRLANAAGALRGFWRERLGQYAGEDEEDYFHIPFVDYARGDGLTIGPGGDKEWDPPRLMLDPPPAWVSGYRGLWGLYARDPFEGEDAPAGPMYNRDKSMNRAWYDPVGWAGLDKVPPPDEVLETALERHADLTARCATLRTAIEEKSSQLKKLGVEVAAMRDSSHLDKPYEEGSRRVTELGREIDQLRAQLATDEVVSESLKDYAARLEAGERDPARAHISRAHRPASDAELRVSRVAEAWAAVSVSLMLISFVGIALFERQHLISMLVVSIALFAFVEAGFRGRLVNLVSSANIGLAVVATLVILYEFFWQLVVAAVLIVGLYVLWDNLRELRR